MRRTRRGGQGGMEFGGSGEDSFVAVVVTKLTGALLFILLLTMVIMALLPKAVDLPGAGESASVVEHAPLEIATPGALPEAIAGRPYRVALAASGGNGPLRWAVDGELPEGLRFDPETGLLSGTPKRGTPKPVELVLRVSDGQDRVARAARLVVYRPNGPLSLPSAWAPGLPPIPWHAWLEQGFGFLVLLLVHLVGMNALGGVERWSSRRQRDPSEPELRSARRRFALYRATVRLATLLATAGLALWLWRQHAA